MKFPASAVLAIFAAACATFLVALCVRNILRCANLRHPHVNAALPLRTGDVVLFSFVGRSFAEHMWSLTRRLMCLSPWTHVGLVYAPKDGIDGSWVVETGRWSDSEGDRRGMQFHRWPWGLRAYAGRVRVRHLDLSEAQRARFLAAAESVSTNDFTIRAARGARALLSLLGIGRRPNASACPPRIGGVFCSEWVAETLAGMGVRDLPAACATLPSYFAHRPSIGNARVLGDEEC